MSLVSRLSNGWKISMDSLKVIRDNKQLLIFPVLSGAAMIVLIASFSFAFIFSSGSLKTLHLNSKAAYYALIFGFYLVNYFIVVFFNVALMRCVRQVFNGEEVDMREGLSYSVNHIAVILGWSVLAATVGTILKIIQQESGTIGKIITGIIGMVWNITTFFVVPLLAYENAGPIDAIKRSAGIVKEKWGESLAGNFSLGLVQLIALLLTAVPLYFLGSLLNPLLGIALAVFAALLVIAVISAAQAVFVSAVYHKSQGVDVSMISEDTMNELFVRK